MLPLPEWCATLRRLTANNDTMAQPTAAMVPRWKASEPLIWDPLRRRLVLTAANDALQESEGTRRHRRPPAPSWPCWPPSAQPGLPSWMRHWPTSQVLPACCGAGTAMASRLASPAQLLDSEHPDQSHSMTVGALLLSPPLTFWQELTQ